MTLAASFDALPEGEGKKLLTKLKDLEPDNFQHKSVSDEMKKWYKEQVEGKREGGETGSIKEYCKGDPFY